MVAVDEVQKLRSADGTHREDRNKENQLLWPLLSAILIEIMRGFSDLSRRHDSSCPP